MMLCAASIGGQATTATMTRSHKDTHVDMRAVKAMRLRRRNRAPYVAPGCANRAG